MTDDWSPPSLYGKGLVTIEPRLFTEADPVPAVSLPAWQQLADDEWSADSPGGTATAELQWSTTTYVGPRRHRPPGRTTSTTATGQPEPQAEDDSNRRLLASSRVMAIAAFTGRITGFLRNVLLVAALGTGLVGDAYNGANNFPNMVYELLLGGVMTERAGAAARPGPGARRGPRRRLRAAAALHRHRGAWRRDDPRSRRVAAASPRRSSPTTTSAA